MPVAAETVRHRVSLMSEDDIYLFNEGNHVKLYDKLGSHLHRDGETDGVYFGVWAPDARAVSVMGDFNGWNKDTHHLSMRGQSGVWEGFIPGIGKGTHYKYHIRSRYKGYEVDKADPYAVHAETPPQNGSIVWDLDYEWDDEEWMRDRHRKNAMDAPISIYEMHIGSWRRVPEDGNRSLNYRELAPQLAGYVKHMGFTHIELMPIMEHPFYGSWGYQTTGYFAPTSRYGTPQDFMYLVDYLHQAGIGVILDWVPSHFPSDEFGLAYFDGTHLYEHKDPRQGLQRDWNSYIFNYGRNEVRAFLISSALYWLEKYHIDGIRVDAVASMLYLDYSRKEGEWVPNKYGGREHIEAIDFLRKLNVEIYQRHPDVQTFAEESTAWPMVARPTYVGGLGFGLKWDMGWMHDTLSYFSKDPIHRKFHHQNLTFRMLYAFSENFVLPLSHDEVVYGKKSLLSKMPGDTWQKFANLRALYAYMIAQPAKKLLFMGGELGQWNEWVHEGSLDWHLLGDNRHNSLNQWVRDLNFMYQNEPALHEIEFSFDGFSWIDCNDADASVISLVRRGKSGDQDAVVAIFNFTPVPRLNYRIGVSRGGGWRELLNSDALEYGGAGFGNMGRVEAYDQPSHGYPCSMNLVLPPLGAIFLKHE